MGYVVTAPLIQVAVNGAAVQIRRGLPLPTVSDDVVKHLLDFDLIAEASTPEAKASEGPNPGTVEFVLAEVGDDPAKAEAALDAERQERGDKARKGLVEKLEAVIAAAEGGQGS